MTYTPKRFWSKVNKKGPYPKPYTKIKTRCWIWTGAIDKDGYGRLSYIGKITSAHRISFYLKYKCWPKDILCHKCDNRKCVRPSHTFEGTNVINMLDKVRKNRQAKGSSIGASKLTIHDVNKIRTLYASKKYYLRELSVKFGVSIAAIHYIVSKKCWAHK